MVNNNHLHTYERVTTPNKKEILICCHPDCNHKILSGPITVLHKRASCYICGNSFVIKRKTLKMRKFRCEDCRRGKPLVKSKIVSQQKLDELLDLY